MTIYNKNIKKSYWVVVFMAFMATALSFLDRQVLSVSIIKIKEDFFISDSDFGLMNTGFLVSYAIMFTVAGVLMDRYGSRKGLAVSVGIWSLATALHSLASNVWQFTLFRFLLGLGEGGAFPGAIKAVVEWVPRKKQALANGIAIGGSAIGAVIAPPLCVYLIAITGWRGVFIVTGMIGIVWVFVWWFLSKKNEDIQETNVRVLNGENKSSSSWKVVFNRIKTVLKVREVWVFILIRFFLDPIFYFYMFWIPKYLNDYRGVSLEKIGAIFWIPFLALGISNILGGYASDALFKKTRNINIARKSVMGLAALLTIPAIFVQYVSTEETVIAIMVIVFFAHGLWITNYITSISDIFGKSITSTIVGLSGSVGAISALVVNPLMGKIISNFSYDPLWIYSGVMYSVMFIFFIVMIPKLTSKEI